MNINKISKNRYYFFVVWSFFTIFAKKIIMRVILSILLFVFSFAINSNAQETARPLTDTEVVRRVGVMDIEGKIFTDVVVRMICNSPDYFLTDKFKVKVNVYDENGNKVWKKTFKNVFLYVFSNGQIQIGKNNFHQLIITKSDDSDIFVGLVREKEGVY